MVPKVPKKKQGFYVLGEGGRVVGPCFTDVQLAELRGSEDPHPLKSRRRTQTRRRRGAASGRHKKAPCHEGAERQSVPERIRAHPSQGAPSASSG